MQGTRKEGHKGMRHQLQYFIHYRVLYVFVYINQEVYYLKCVCVAQFFLFFSPLPHLRSVDGDTFSSLVLRPSDAQVRCM